MLLLRAPEVTWPGRSDTVVKLPLPPALDLTPIPSCPKMPCTMGGKKRRRKKMFRRKEEIHPSTSMKASAQYTQAVFLNSL